MIPSEIPLEMAVSVFKAYTYKNKDNGKRDISHIVLEAVKQMDSW